MREAASTKLTSRYRRGNWRRIFSLLASLVVIGTFAALTLPALSATWESLENAGVSAELTDAVETAAEPTDETFADEVADVTEPADAASAPNDTEGTNANSDNSSETAGKSEASKKKASGKKAKAKRAKTDSKSSGKIEVQGRAADDDSSFVDADDDSEHAISAMDAEADDADAAGADGSEDAPKFVISGDDDDAETSSSDGDAADDADAADEGQDPEASTEADKADADAQGEDDPDTMPAQTFTEQLKDENGDATLTVTVEAPEGAFPANATMQVEAVKAQDVRDAVAEAIAERDDAKVGAMQAVDITFASEDGEPLEPETPVSVKFASSKIEQAESDAATAPMVVHVGDDGAAEVLDRLTPAELKQRDQELAADELMVNAESFSVYVLAFTVDFSYGVDGDTFEFTLHGGGDSASLRDLMKSLRVAEDDPSTPENELDAFMAGIANVEFSDPTLLYVGKAAEDTTSGKIISANKLQVAFPLGLTQQEVLDINAAAYRSGDWVLIALQPFDTAETLAITMENGESFEIDVTDAQDAMMDGDHVQTIANPAGTTIDLFDYWVVAQDLAGRDGWGDLNQGDGWNNDNHNPRLNGTGNNKGINASSDAAHGHALKFSPAWEGTVYNGTKNGWTSVNGNGKDGLNSYTGNGNPFQGIVQGQLSGGYPALANNDTIGSDGESLAYLFDPNVGHGGKASYSGVDQLMYVDKDGYYTYDSRDYAAALNDDGKTFTVTEQTSSNTEIRGFWPFGIQNFWVGMHVNTQFSMPANGQVLNPKGEYRDMQFEFSGDDDTWLYVDGVLVGDGGGIHNRTEIDVNFAAGTVTVTGKQDPAHPGGFEETRYLDDIFNAAGKGPQANPDDWEQIPGSSHYRFKAGTYHTFDMFYLERGGGESNLYIHYNLVSTADFTAHKAYHGMDEDDRLLRNQFQFELIGLDGKYRLNNGALVLDDPNARAIMPKTASASGAGAGTVEDPSYDDDTTTQLSSGVVGSQTYITSVTEDGNVNFGTAEISQEDMNEADQGNPPVYRYLIQEVVPDDAVNGDGVAWADATPEQRAAGEFVKDYITYDGRIYYMAARVTSWTETDASGREIVRHGLSKTYYTDDTYTTVDGGVTFANFDNRHRPAFGNVDFTKVDGSGNPLQGATFALYKDEACTIPATYIDQDGRPAIQATSGADGKVRFENVRIGTYYMKETVAPNGYALDGTVYEVTIQDANVASKRSTMTVLGDETGAQVSQVVNTESGKLSVNKKWLNSVGAEVPGGTNAATVWLKRIHQEQDAAAGNHAVTIQMTVEDGGVQYGSQNNVTVAGNTVTIEWDDEWQRNFNWDLTVGDNHYEGWIGEEHVETSNYEFHQISNDGRSRQLIIKNLSGSESISLTTKYWVNWLHSDPNHWSRLNNPQVTGSGASYSPADDVAFNAEKHTQLLDNSGGAAWSHTWTIGGTESSHDGFDYPATDDGGREYRYYVAELDDAGEAIAIGDVATGDYVLQGYSPNNNVGVANQGVITVYNKEDAGPTASLNIVKIAAHEADAVDEAGTAGEAGERTYLDGAVFHLEKKTAGGVYEAYGESFTVSGANGVTIDGLSDGDYRLAEDQAPAGYLVISSSYEFSVANGAVVEGEPTALVEYAPAAGNVPAQFAVVNTPGKPLPNTGGPGTMFFYLAGTLMLLAGGLVLLRKLRSA